MLGPVMLLGTLLKLYREHTGLSLRKLGKIIGVDAHAIWRFERGRNLNSEQWSRIVKWVLTEQESNDK